MSQLHWKVEHIPDCWPAKFRPNSMKSKNGARMGTVKGTPNPSFHHCFLVHFFKLHVWIYFAFWISFMAEMNKNLSIAMAFIKWKCKGWEGKRIWEREILDLLKWEASLVTDFLIDCNICQFQCIRDNFNSLHIPGLDLLKKGHTSFRSLLCSAPGEMEENPAL